MSLLPLFSSAAIVIGLAAALPQLYAMVRARSAAGQSALGWLLGATVNTLMAYVNLVGYKATALAAGNVASLAICLAAVGLVVRLGAPATAEEDADPPPAFHELPTMELIVLREQLEYETRRRDERRTVLPAAA
jgi:PQ loop repeat